MFTVEAWVRLDTANLASNGFLQHIFGKKNAGGTYVFAVSISNTFMRVLVNEHFVDHIEAFSSNSAWRYIAVSVIQETSARSKVLIFIDNALVLSTTVSDVLTDSTTNTAYIGDGFEGNILYLAVDPMSFEAFSTPPTVDTTCAALGSTSSCPVCKKAASSTCYSACALNTYTTTCTECMWSCQYCGDASTCVKCNEPNNVYGTPPSCACGSGFYLSGS